mmetsp:Transcript_50718/g.51115  ORF Transcript_50718/g.51115 Transcript_50718/m.51115 type:complete len:223 (+) Transcript_50718:129-797(+)
MNSKAKEKPFESCVCVYDKRLSSHKETLQVGRKIMKKNKSVAINEKHEIFEILLGKHLFCLQQSVPCILQFFHNLSNTPIQFLRNFRLLIGTQQRIRITQIPIHNVPYGSIITPIRTRIASGNPFRFHPQIQLQLLIKLGILPTPERQQRIDPSRNSNVNQRLGAPRDQRRPGHTRDDLTHVIIADEFELGGGILPRFPECAGGRVGGVRRCATGIGGAGEA